MSLFPRTDGSAHVRWLLLGSLALNLFFVGAAGAVAFRYSSPVPLTAVARIDHSLAARLDRIAASLPPADADVMRDELRIDAEKVATVQADLRLSQDDLRKALRAQPFDAAAMQTAMAASRAAHQNADQLLHDMISASAPKMSVVGRTKLADWPAEHAGAREPH